jgi:hypothetical protein
MCLLYFVRMAHVGNPLSMTPIPSLGATTTNLSLDLLTHFNTVFCCIPNTPEDSERQHL